MVSEIHFIYNIGNNSMYNVKGRKAYHNVVFAAADSLLGQVDHLMQNLQVSVGMLDH